MIKINENLYIDADDNQYMLRKFIGKDKDGEHIETKYCEGGSITDLMAWLESEEEC